VSEDEPTSRPGFVSAFDRRDIFTGVPELDHLPVQLRRKPVVVVIEEGHERGFGPPHAGVPRGPRTGRRSEPDQMDALVRCDLGRKDEGRLRPVVNDPDFHRPIGLDEGAPNRPTDDLVAVPRWDDDRDRRARFCAAHGEEVKLVASARWGP
jgi:hypothetical protein